MQRGLKESSQVMKEFEAKEPKERAEEPAVLPEETDQMFF